MINNHTSKYQLSQWEKSDKVLMEDFNSDNQKIEAALAAKADQSELDALSGAVASLPEIPRIAIGTYRGGGGVGVDHPTVVTFPFEPKLVVVMAGNIYAIFLSGVGSAQARAGEYLCYYVVTWKGATLSWYMTGAVKGTGSNLTANEAHQMNAPSGTYTYFAIG